MIDFTFSEEQELFRKAARDFAETEIAPHVAKMEETGRDWEPVIEALGKAEMMAITIPEEFGGLGLGYVERLIALEEIARSGQLMVYKHPGFWACMDTLRDMDYLNRLWVEGKATWKVW